MKRFAFVSLWVGVMLLGGAYRVTSGGWIEADSASTPVRRDLQAF
jgi:hypothetical protein